MEKEEQAPRDVEQAEVQRTRGNELFKNGTYLSMDSLRTVVLMREVGGGGRWGFGRVG